MTTMHTIKFVEIVRAEGLAHECDRPERFFGPAALLLAKLRLGEWARTAPDAGGYDKCDFKIEWTDGATYEGRADITREHAVRGYDLSEHITRFLRFVGGLWTDAEIMGWISPVGPARYMPPLEEAKKRYAQAVARHNTSKAEIKSFLATHAL